MITDPGANKDGTNKDGTDKDSTDKDSTDQDGMHKDGANKDLVRAFVTAWNDRDFGRFDDLMGAGAVLHVGGAAVSCDPAGTRAIAEQWTTAFPDWRFDLLSLVAE